MVRRARGKLSRNAAGRRSSSCSLQSQTATWRPLLHFLSSLTLLPAIHGEGKLACFTLLTREAGTARSPLGFSSGFRKPAPNPGEEKLPLYVLGPKLRKIWLWGWWLRETETLSNIPTLPPPWTVVTSKPGVFILPCGSHAHMGQLWHTFPQLQVQWAGLNNSQVCYANFLLNSTNICVCTRVGFPCLWPTQSHWVLHSEGPT